MLAERGIGDESIGREVRFRGRGSRWAEWSIALDWRGARQRSDLRLQFLPDFDRGVVESNCETSDDPGNDHVTFLERIHDDFVIGRQRVEAKCLTYRGQGSFDQR